MADNGDNSELRRGRQLLPVEMADNGLDLQLGLGLPQPPAPEPPVLASAELPDWPPTLSLPSRPNPEFLITWLLNTYLMGLYHLFPANLRNEIIELNAKNFFALNHNEMRNEFYFCQDNVPRPLVPWIRSEGRKVFTNGNVIGRFATYRLGGGRVRFTRYTSILQQQGQNIALYRIRARDEN